MEKEIRITKAINETILAELNNVMRNCKSCSYDEASAKWYFNTPFRRPDAMGIEYIKQNGIECYLDLIYSIFEAEKWTEITTKLAARLRRKGLIIDIYTLHDYYVYENVIILEPERSKYIKYTGEE